MQKMLACLGLIAFFHAAPATASDLVVVAASNAGKKLMPGATLKSGSTVRLEKTARLTLLAKSGQVIKLRGPYDGVPAAPSRAGGGSSLSKIAAVFNKHGRSATVGATRKAIELPGSAVKAAPADPWVLEVERPGQVCLRTAPTILWRRDTTHEAEVTIWPLSRGPRRQRWPKGNDTLEIPKDAIEAGMQISYRAGPKSLALVASIYAGKQTPQESGKRLSWMAAEGCGYQAVKLALEIHGAD